MKSLFNRILMCNLRNNIIFFNYQKANNNYVLKKIAKQIETYLSNDNKHSKHVYIVLFNLL